MTPLDLHTAALFLLINIVGAADGSASLQISFAEKITEGTVADRGVYIFITGLVTWHLPTR